MAKLTISAIKTARPRQWVKNLIIFATLIFTNNLFNAELFIKTVYGFLALSALASAVYFINDIFDRQSDKLHPFKKNRPIAKGDLPIHTAIFIAITGIVTSLAIATVLSNFFFLSLLAYLLLQITYTFWLKNIAVVDIFAIATGFILRIYAGAFLINANPSVWFLLCVISLSLFLAAGKRRAELAVLAEHKSTGHRKSLSVYSPQLLDSYLAMFATASWVSWAIFTFFTEEERSFYISQAVSPSLLANLPLTILGSGKLLMLTIPIAIFGVMRYLRIVYDGSKAETPEKVLLTDKPLLISVSLWIATILIVIYSIGNPN